jgi:hypothetical protein
MEPTHEIGRHVGGSGDGHVAELGVVGVVEDLHRGRVHLGIVSTPIAGWKVGVEPIDGILLSADGLGGNGLAEIQGAGGGQRGAVDGTLETGFGRVQDSEIDDQPGQRNDEYQGERADD